MTNITEDKKTYLIKKRFSDIDAYLESLESWEVNLVQLNSGYNACGQLFLSTSDFEFLFFDHAVKSLLHTQQSKPGICLLIPLSHEPLNYIDQEFDQATLCCVPHGASTTFLTPDNFSGATMYISNEKLNQLHQQGLGLTGFSTHNGCQYYQPTAQQLTQLKSALALIAQRFQHAETIDSENAQWLNEFSTQQVMPLFTDIVASQKIIRIKYRPAAFCSALEIAFAEIDAPPSIAELSLQLKMSTRNLQYIFKTHLGLTPKQFIKVLRLNVARKQLWHSSFKRGRVADIANSLGYWHMGSFAQDFKQLFQLSPTDILRINNDSQKVEEAHD